MKRSGEEVLSLIDRAQSGDLRARQRLIESNIGLVKRVVQRWNVSDLALEFDDLVMHGVLGLDKAISNYNPRLRTRTNPNEPVPFAHHAASWIRSFVGHAAEDAGRVIRLPSYTLPLYRRLEAERERFRVERGWEPDKAELGALLPEVSAAVLDTLIGGRPQACPFVGITEDGGEAPVFDPPCPDHFEERVLDCHWVSFLLDQLPDDFERWVLIHHFGLEGEEARTSRELAQVLGVSHTTIDNFVKKALGWLRRNVIQPERLAGGVAG